MRHDMHSSVEERSRRHAHAAVNYVNRRERHMPLPQWLSAATHVSQVGKAEATPQYQSRTCASKMEYAKMMLAMMPALMTRARPAMPCTQHESAGQDPSYRTLRDMLHASMRLESQSSSWSACFRMRCGGTAITSGSSYCLDAVEVGKSRAIAVANATQTGPREADFWL